MSLFNDASLVMIPSGYKTSKVYSVKPDTGAGDLTFTRSNDTATRVGPDGLIEKVRTNLVLQSNTFNTTWSTSSATITGGQAGYDGTNNAWELNSSVSGGSILQSNTQAGLQTFSVYAKGSVSTGIRLYAFGSVNFFAYFNLNTGAVGSASAGVTARIQSVGGGWYRCSISFDQTNTQVRFYTTDNNNANAAGIVYIQNAQLETGDIATQPILTTSAAVSVGPVANVPRLDYLNSSCPRLLLEPQRTNLVLFSENIDNASWLKVATTVTANTETSPDGTLSADTILANGASGLHAVQTNAVPYTSGTAASFSVFAKKGTNDFIQLIAPAAVGGMFANFDLNTGVVGTLGTTSGTNPTSSIQDYGNGWYRCVINFTPDATSASVTSVAIVTSASAVRAQSNTLATSIFLWGVQAEAGAYATSYIPTLGAAVTRGADAASKTGISSLIGQTEGTLFAEFVPNGNFQHRFSIAQAGSSDNWIFFSMPEASNGNGRVYIRTNSSTWVDTGDGLLGAFVNGQRYKVALAYKSGSWAIYVNGVLKNSGSQTFTAPSVPIDGFYPTGTGGTIAVQVQLTTTGLSQALLFKTRLTNAQLAELTTI